MNLHKTINLRIFDYLSIGKQITLCFGLPLLLVAGFSAALWCSDQGYFASEQADYKKRQALEHLEHISILSGDSFASLFSDKSDEAIARSDHMTEISAQVAELDTLLKSDRTYLAELGQLTEMLDKQVKMLFYLHSRPRRSIEHALESEEVAGSLANYADLSQTILQRIQREITLVEQKKLEETRAFARFHLFLPTGLIGSILIALAMGSMFFFRLQKRLQTVTTNIESLAAGTIGARLSGADELSYLNDCLIDTMEKFLSAQQKRQEVVQMVTHDLRSPLSAINATIDNLVKTPCERDPLLERLTSIKHLTVQMSKMANDFLLIEKLDNQGLTFKQDEIDLRAAVSDCINGLADKSKEKSLTLRNACGEYVFATDEVRFTQVLNNLLTNAIKVSPVGAEIEVSTQERKGFIHFSVLDQGPGVDSSETNRLFDRFYQSKDPSGDGFGFGLFIVKALVVGQGGSVGVESTIGRGSRFWFTLPYNK